MAGVIFCEVYVVAYDTKWQLDSVDAKVYTDKAEAQAVADRHNELYKLEGKHAVQVLDLNKYMDNQRVECVRDALAGADL